MSQPLHLPTLRQLQFLCAVAETGSFSLAAERCLVTQSALSAAIKEMEKLIDVQLLERGRHGARLTEAGEESVRRARRILAEAADLVLAARGAAVPLAGRFGLGAIPTIAPYLLPKAMPLLRKTHPDLKLYLREDLTARLIEAVRAHRLDAAIIALPYDIGDLQSLVLGGDEFLLLTPGDHPLATKPAIVPEDLLSVDTLLLEDGHCLREHALQACRLSVKSGSGPIDLAATSLPTLIQMVAGGLGISVLPKMAAEAGAVAGIPAVARPFSPPVNGRSITLVWRKGSAREEEVRMLGALIASSAQLTTTR